MTYKESIKKGFSVINSNWQLVLFQAGMMLASFFGFFIVVGLPLAIAFIIFGLDLTGLLKFHDIFSIFRNPADILSRYLWLIILVLASLLLYVLIVIAMGIFVFSGSVGIIGKAVMDGPEQFRVRAFFSEGRRLFFKILGFTALIGLMFIVLAFVLGIMGGVIAAIVSKAREYEAVLALFIGIFFSLVLFVTGIAMILSILAVTVYGIAGIAMKGSSPYKAITESARFTTRDPKAFLLYCIVFFGYIIISVLLMFIGYPFRLVPLIGPLMSATYQLVVYVIQSYLGLATLAVIFSYYHSAMNASKTEGFQEGNPPISGDSSDVSDTSWPQAYPQDQTPDWKDRSL